MGRFALKSREFEFDQSIAEFDTFTAAETYQKALGRTGEHVKLFIVDKKVNVLADAADDAEQKKLDKAMEVERQRKELMDLQAANNERAKQILAETASLNVNNPTAPTPTPDVKPPTEVKPEAKGKASGKTSD